MLQDRGLNLLREQGIEVLLGETAAEVTKDNVSKQTPLSAAYGTVLYQTEASWLWVVSVPGGCHTRKIPRTQLLSFVTVWDRFHIVQLSLRTCLGYA